MPTLHIYLLGEFCIVYDKTPVTTIDWPRLQSLLAYLILHRDTAQSRTHLAFLLWPDSTEEQAHTNLRHLVYRLRHALPNASAYLRADKQTLRWQPEAPWTCDVSDFERAIVRADQAGKMEDRTTMRLALEEARKLYTGNLLPNVYEEWLLLERERLHKQFLDALEKLALLFERERKYREAISVAQQLLRHDPLQEVTYRLSMRLYASSGDRASALRTYHTCVSILQRELAIEPSSQTQEAYQRLVQKDVAMMPSTVQAHTLVSITPIVNRQSEWAHIQDIWQRVLDGRPHMLVLLGEAGVGKTRLAEELLTWVERQGMVAVSAYCYPAEGELAYAPITTWLRANAIKPTLTALADVWLTEVARFVPEVLLERPGLSQPGPLVENWQRQRLFEALARAILGARQPLLLLLDDLHWCDRETLEWLHYLLRFDAHARVLIVGTARSEEMVTAHPLESLLETLQRRGQMTEIMLDPLNAVDTASLAAYVVGRAIDPQLASDLYRDTEGNPLFIVETVRAGALAPEESEHQSDEDRTLPHISKLPPAVQAVIAARLAQLSLPARELLNLAAVIGRAFTFEVLSKASTDDEDTLVRGLDELWQRRIVREHGADAYDFSHDKLREAVYASLRLARRRLLHRRVAEALEAVHADRLDTVSGLVAAHYEQAGIFERAVIYYQRAAEVARRVYANAEAIRFYQRVLVLLNVISPDQSGREPKRDVIIRVYESLGDVFTLTVQLVEARKAYQEALAYVPTYDRIKQAYLYRKNAQTWTIQRRFKEALQALSIAEAALEGKSAERTAEWWQAWIDIQQDRIENHYWLAQLHEITELVEKARPMVDRYGSRAQRASFFQSLVYMNLRGDRYVISEETLEYARLSLAARLELANETDIAYARFLLGFAYLWYGNLDLAEEQFHAAQLISKQTGDVALQSLTLTYLTVLCRKRGQIEETRQLSSLALEVATKVQRPEYIGMAKANQAWLAWREGNLSEAQAKGLAALELWRPLQIVYVFHWAALWPLIGVALTQDRFAEAVEHARLLLAPRQQPLPDTLNTLVEAVILSWEAGQFEVVRIRLQQATALAQEMGYL